jgi:hypothetical protein
VTAKIVRTDNLPVVDLIRSITRQAKPKPRDDSRKLRGQVVTSYALIKSGLDPKSFGMKYADRVVRGRPIRRSRLEQRWMSGEVAPGPRKLRAMNQDIPGVVELDADPVFQLLQDLPLSVKFIREQLAGYSPKERIPGRAWIFPDEAERMESKNWITVMAREHVEPLVHRCDLTGFTVILGLAREAEALGNVQAHIHNMIHLYRSTPAVLAIPWFKPHHSLLESCVDAIHRKCELSYLLLEADWNRIRSYSSTMLAEGHFSSCFASQTFWRKVDDKIEEDVVQMAEPHYRSPSR